MKKQTKFKQLSDYKKPEYKKLKPINKFILIIFFFLICLLFYLLGIYFKPKLLSSQHDFSTNKSDINNLPNNLSLHICSSECIYALIVYDKSKLNDSFIINNKLNSSNCIKCYSTDWKF